MFQTIRVNPAGPPPRPFFFPLNSGTTSVYSAGFDGIGPLSNDAKVVDRIVAG